MTLTTNPKRFRTWSAGLAATLLLTASASALHAETSNAELAREIAELKAQIRAMKGAITQNRAETRKAVRVARTPAPGYALPPPSGPAFPAGAIPVGATPAFVTADKKLQFGAITLTPGGFLAAESVYRTRTVNSDVNTAFGAIPFQNQSLGRADEFRLSARQTRLALLAEAAITPNYLAAGYVEFDFLGAAPTANSNQTNSYTPRIRNLYATLDETNYGMHVLAGQNWSLLTLNSKGITPRNEVTPAVIDSAQVVGSVYARQAQIRLTKDFNKKLWMAVSVEESEGTFTPGCGTATAQGGIGLTPAAGVIAGLPGVANVVCGATGQGANSTGTNYSLNHAPDVIGKVAYEARALDRDIHLEAMGLYANFYDRVQYTGANNAYVNRDTNGWGVGGGVIAAVIPKRLDFQVNGLYGRGVNRYGPGGIGEATFNPNGSLKPVRGVVALTGLIAHITPAIDVYGYAGLEQVYRSYFGNGAAGFGGPNINDNGCFTEGAAAATCSGTTRRLYEFTAGFWDKLYKGSFGEVRVGANYAFIHRDIFNQPGLATPGVNDHQVMTSFRYYPFQ